MKELQRIAKLLRETQTRNNMIYNYTIPQIWDTFGYEKGQRLRNHEMIVDPYDFYAFALEKIAEQKWEDTSLCKEKGKQGSWIKKQFIYDLDLVTLTSWDHDRNEAIEVSDLYGCNEQGTFLKAIILLPLLKRAGITTLMLHHFLSLDDKRTNHNFSDPHAMKDPLCLNAQLSDPLLSACTLEEQFQLFIDTAHLMGFRLLADCSFARMGRNAEVLKEHPEWFYWIQSEAIAEYHAPHVPGLPKGCIPSKKVCKVLYQCEDTKQHVSLFTVDPKTQDPEAFTNLVNAHPEHLLRAIEEAFHCTTAPIFSDQINSDYPVQMETTMLRFYHDQPLQKIPYLLQDTLRPDLFPGKQPIKEVWEYLIQATCTYVTKYHFDGISIGEPWHYPRQLIKTMIQEIRKFQPNVAILIEETDEQNAKTWQRIGADLIYGSSAYLPHDPSNHAYHTFAYARNSTTACVLAASEFKDTPRITQYQGRETLAKLMIYMNLFLPNCVPYLASGQLTLEQQPQYLSPFADPSFANALPKDDIRAFKQSMLDRSFYSYTRSDSHILINQLEKLTQIRQRYLHAITRQDHCIPVWFDDPRDPGIGFTYPLKDSALLVVCNADIEHEVSLTIHTENMLWELPFEWSQIRQIYSSHSPYVFDVTINEFQNIPMYFAPGEIKLLEIME